jgi:hypothetical protein
MNQVITTRESSFCKEALSMNGVEELSQFNEILHMYELLMFVLDDSLMLQTIFFEAITD